MIRSLLAGSAIALAYLALGGCTTVVDGFGPNPPKIPSPGTLNTYYTSYNTFTGTPSEYVGVGYASTYEACSNYFDVLIRSQNMTAYSGDIARSVGATGIALNALRKDAELAQREIVRWTAATGLVTTIIDAFDDRALMTPYPTETKTLILRALTTYEQRNPPSAADTRAEALSFVAGYAEMCTYSGVTRFSKQALSNAEPKPGGSSAMSAADQALLKALATTLGDPSVPLSLRQVAVAYYHFVESPEWADDAVETRKALIGELPESLRGEFLSADGKPKKISEIPVAASAKRLLTAFVDGNADVKREIDAVKVAMATPTKQVADLTDKTKTKTKPQLVFPDNLGAASTSRQEVRF
jgi:hypothetical protein